jgi:hypothetical protein
MSHRRRLHHRRGQEHSRRQIHQIFLVLFREHLSAINGKPGGGRLVLAQAKLVYEQQSACVLGFLMIMTEIAASFSYVSISSAF